MAGTVTTGYGKKRGTDLGVTVRVWQWDDEAMAVHDHILERVVTQVYAGFLAGLAVDEMEDDLIQAFPIFDDSFVEFETEGRLHVILVPVQP